METLHTRSVGLFCHPTSLPSPHGIGTLGAPAKQFADFLASANISYWQMCPLGPTGYGDSPYQSFSAFAGNPYLIDLNELKDLGLLEDHHLEPLQSLPHDHVDFAQLYQLHNPILKIAASNFLKTNNPLTKDYKKFVKTHRDWLEPYSKYRALKTHFNEAPFTAWDEKFRTFESAKKSSLIKKLADEINLHNVTQFFFFKQLHDLRNYCRERDIKFIGDMPIFVALDSADVWSHPHLFELTPNGKPKRVAGVPPDYFSPDGQLWGNPLYDWPAHKKEKYAWWLKRFEHNQECFDTIRIDHFRAFYNYYAIRADAPTARKGRWLKGPQYDFFNALYKKFPDIDLIAEDLGDIDDRVRNFRDDLELPGMAVLQFAFNNDPKNIFLPHHLTQNQVTYSGTHDNDTTRSWYSQQPEDLKDQIRRTLNISGDEISWDFIRLLYRCNSNLAILTAPDILNKNANGRFNTPGTPGGNWQWRMTQDELTSLQNGTANYLKELATLYDR